MRNYYKSAESFSFTKRKQGETINSINKRRNLIGKQIKSELNIIEEKKKKKTQTH